MALNKETIEQLLNKLDYLQKQIDEIHNELLTEINDDELSHKEKAEIEAIRRKNDYRTFSQWEKEKFTD